MAARGKAAQALTATNRIRGRDAEDEKRDRVVTRLTEIALEGAEAAMETMVRAARGNDVPPGTLRAAEYVLDQLMGKAAPKMAQSGRDDKGLALLSELRTLREHEYSRVADTAVAPGDGGVVEEAAGPLHPDDGPMAYPYRPPVPV